MVVDVVTQYDLVLWTMREYDSNVSLEMLHQYPLRMTILEPSRLIGP